MDAWLKKSGGVSSSLPLIRKVTKGPGASKVCSERKGKSTDPMPSSLAIAGRKRFRVDSLEDESPMLSKGGKGGGKAALQTHLDFGQKDVGGKQCSRCGMVYSVGVASEEKAHTKFCQSRTCPVDFKSSKSDKVVWEGREEMIVHLPHTSMSAAQRNMWEGLKGVVDETMGFYDGSEDKGKVINCLYIKGTKVVGLLVVEPIDEGYPIVTAESTREGIKGGDDVHAHTGDDETPLASASPDGGLVCTTTSRKAVLGVSQVWVHDDYRRQGIASKLLTSARNHFIYGYHIPVDKVAFTQPTPAGRSFAEKYTATKGFLVYNNSPVTSA